MTTTLSIRLSPEIEQSIIDFAETTTGREMKRAADIRRDKIYALRQFFALVKKSPDRICDGQVFQDTELSLLLVIFFIFNCFSNSIWLL